MTEPTSEVPTSSSSPAAAAAAAAATAAAVSAAAGSTAAPPESTAAAATDRTAAAGGGTTAAAGAAATAAAATGAAKPAWVSDVLKKDIWESRGQHAARVEYINKVILGMEEEGDLNEDRVRMLSGLFYAIRFLGCTYTSDLEELLCKYDPSLYTIIEKQRQTDNKKKGSTKQQQQQQQQ
ncbi:hypothetical protein, conserved [Eimeria praecox]|uniref:XRN2-binding (XTBD) domain-containing protein n=1 Tax=Eimeria praecox TaxID=51316 RepID=U6GXV9_9EIME|nr:hypothetical protein, conserved [Eimeria praecox]